MRPTLELPRLTMPVSTRDHIRGNINAPVTLLEYGDFECLHCAAAHKILSLIRIESQDWVRFVYRHFPLATVHPHATASAEAAEAAGGQGKFWDMHDFLFENQESLGDTELIDEAHTLGLDTDQFAQDMEEHVYLRRVQEDFRSGIRSGVNGTPAFFINGHRHNGGYDLESLWEAVVIAKKG